MLRIGLTGGIGSGKSSVAALLTTRGVPVIDTDEIAHRLTEPGRPEFDEIVRVFGQNILDPSHKIDRNKLRERVFGNSDERRQLEAILHPRIREVVREKLQELHAPYCVIVVPLLFESGFLDLVDRVLVADVSESAQVQRTAARSGLTEAEIRKIMATQVNRAQRLQRADDVIDNNGDRRHLQKEVERLHQWYLSLAATTKNN